MSRSGGVEAVVFDLGNVLIDFDHTIAARRISCFTDKTADEIYQLFFDSPITGQFEEGKISPPDFFAAVKRMLDARLSYEEFLSVWNEIFLFTDTNKRVYEIAKKLRSRYTVVLLSNVNRLHWEYIKKTFPIYDAFHHLFASFEVGARKPSPVIYSAVLSALHLPAEKVFYTDDRADLIERACSLGFQGFVFKSPRQLLKDFARVGIQGFPDGE